MRASADSLERRALNSNPFDRSPRCMWVIFLEIGLAIGLAAFILWWTWPRKREPDDAGATTGEDEAER